MKVPTLVLMDEDGAYTWEGSALEFVRDNALTRDEVHDLCTTLRGVDNRSEPWIFGGGAAPLFYVLLSE